MKFEDTLRNRRVMVTGHTGFTGSWLSLWLHRIGCEVSGLSLAPNTSPSLFVEASIEAVVTSHIGDIRDFATVCAAVAEAQPEIIFHLAAQPLVSRSYEEPIESYAINALGTAHVLEAARTSRSVKAVVCITTDKVYDDQDWEWGYRETDRLGGKDPYSASKACAELIAASYQRTMAARGNGVRIAVARGGNIIGGGDWAEDRIVPDFVRAVTKAGSLTLRHPEAIRPWQHVLALAHGYLMLGAALVDGDEHATQSWNFGPQGTDAHTVADLLEALSKNWMRPDLQYKTGGFPETRFLRVDSSKARQHLGWSPPIDFLSTCAMTANWFKAYYANPGQADAITLEQIDHYRSLIERG